MNHSARPIVSVVVPNYNHQQFLRTRLESVTQQTFQDYEIILLDDHSTDDSAAMLEEWRSHPKVCRCQFNSENSGSPFAQWKKGLSLAKGELVWIAESDDFCEPTFLEKCAGTLIDNPTASVAFCRSVSVDEEGEMGSDHFFADDMDPKRWRSSYVNDGSAELISFLRFRNIIPNASGAVFRRTLLPLDDVPVSMRYAGDWLVWQTLATRGSFCFIAEALNYHRFHSRTTRATLSAERERARFDEYGKCLAFGASYRQINPITDFRKLEWAYQDWRYRTGGRQFNLLLRPSFPAMVRMSFTLLHLRYFLIRARIRLGAFRRGRWSSASPVSSGPNSPQGRN